MIKPLFKLNKFDKMLKDIFRSICGFFSLLLFLSWFFSLLLFLSLFRFSLFLFTFCLWLFLWWFFFFVFCWLFSLFCGLFSLLLFLWLFFSLLFSFKKNLIKTFKSIIVWLIYWKSIYQNIFNILWSSYHIKIWRELIYIADIMHILGLKIEANVCLLCIRSSFILPHLFLYWQTSMLDYIFQ